MGKRRLGSILITFVLCFVFWMLLTMSVAPKELISGVIICGIAAWFSSGFFVQNDRQSKHMLNPWRWIKLVFYFVVIFFGEVIKANLAMVKTVFSGKPLKQAIIRIPVNGLEDEYALGILADCITLTPGTITIDVAYDENGDTCMYVHWIIMESEDREKAGEIIKGRMEKWLRRAWK